MFEEITASEALSAFHCGMITGAMTCVKNCNNPRSLSESTWRNARTLDNDGSVLEEMKASWNQCSKSKDYNQLTEWALEVNGLLFRFLSGTTVWGSAYCWMIMALDLPVPQAAVYRWHIIKNLIDLSIH